MHSSNPVLGEEQLLDVELDRNTDFLPPHDEQLPSWRDDGEEARSGTADACFEEEEKDTDSGTFR